jgi:hypothetical protein
LGNKNWNGVEIVDDDCYTYDVIDDVHDDVNDDHGDYVGNYVRLLDYN